MTKTFAARTAPIALAALLTTSMLLAVNALAGHQYRVAGAAARQYTQVTGIAVQHACVPGHRIALA